MGNKVSSPLMGYDVASSHFSPAELEQVRKAFRTLSPRDQPMDRSAFTQNSPCSPYISKYILPRVFSTIDTKKDNVLDFEEYVCAMGLFRFGSLEDKSRLLFLMYLPSKGGVNLLRENLRSLLKDANAVQQQNETALPTYESWIEDMNEIVDGMADMVLTQYASTDNRLTFSEFCAFVKVDGTVQSLMGTIGALIER
eukprot:gene8206-16877_t